MKESHIKVRAVPHRVEQKLESLVGRYRSGFTLPAEFYLDPEIFDYEMEHVLGRNWWLARFSSELARPGDYAVVNVARSSIILIRGRDGAVRGFYNVCRHRGALSENQVRGVRSPAYSPGPLGHMEPGTHGFLDWYIAALRRSLERKLTPAETALTVPAAG